MTLDLETANRLLASTATPYGSTRWKNLQTCEVAHNYDYDLTTRRSRSESSENAESESLESRAPLVIGSLVHAVLAYCAEAECDKQPRPDWTLLLDHALATFTGSALDSEIYADCCAEAERLCGAYFNYWGDWSQAAGTGYSGVMSARVIDVERPLQQLAGDSYYSGCADLVIEIDSRLWIVDHKTRARTPLREKDFDDATGAFRALQQEQAVMPQFLGLSWLLREAEGLDYYPGVIVDYIIKTRVPGFMRVPFQPSDRAIKMWLSAQWQLSRRLLSVVQDPVPNFHECVDSFGKRCRHFARCHLNGGE